MMRYFAAACVGFTAAIAHAAPVQWSGNGHYYELVSPANGITWKDAKAAAASATYSGLPGSLATLTSAAEWQFVQTTFPTQFTWIGLTDEATEGTFLWTTGETSSYSAWLPGEPNNAADDPGEDYVWYEQRNGQWGWNDYQNVSAANTGPQQFPTNYVIEYGAVPEPSAIAFAGPAILLASAGRSRKRCGR